ncbi:MAG: hypothetical protein B7Y99_01470 [Caulobacterales bacterium 32-69-10]|nr:MAG: hypothetical protein B7Y99_01470 [Caulobacterales bacterium 32-69-10]
MDYATTYDGYWLRPDRFGESSFPDPRPIARNIIGALGAGSFLDIGCGMGDLVQALMLDGMDAQGVDVSAVAVAEASRRAPGRFHVGSVLALPFPDASFDNVVSTDCLEHLAPEDVAAALREMRRVARRGAYLVIATRPDRERAWHLTVRDRRFWESAALEAGFRRHPAALRVTPYGALDREVGETTLALEAMPPGVAEAWPLEALSADRELHMDMLREPGSRSDAHLMRYHWAARFARAGDRILDAACGMGYGAWLLASQTEAAEVLGLDIDEAGIAYARQAFSGLDKLRFEIAGLPEGLARLSENSFDLITSFETLEHVVDPAALLEAFARLLAPGGRVLVSVPNDWSDETGRDPNPYHFDVYDWPKLKALVERDFLLDRAATQTADRAKLNGAWSRQGRVWEEFDPVLGVPPRPAEWLIAAGQKRFAGPGLPPWDRAARVAGQPSSAPPVDFAGMLDNPWLVRGLVDRGTRLNAPGALAAVCAELAIKGEPHDAAAAVTVLGYRLLEDPKASSSAVRSHLDSISARLRVLEPGGGPHALRWRVSLCFVAARLAQKIGDLDAAEAWFERVLSEDAARFGPTLFTKTTEACHRLGWLKRAKGDLTGAGSAWARGLEEAERMLALPVRDAFGPQGTRFAFVFDEYSAVCETANLCAMALERLETDPQNALRQSEVLSRPRRRVELLSEELRLTRARGASPEPVAGAQFWTVRELLRTNKWCRPPEPANPHLHLHPTALGHEDQPEAIMQAPLPKNARHVFIVAEAISPASPGVVVMIGGANAPDASMLRLELAAREPQVLRLDAADLREAHGGEIRVTVATRALARSISSSGVRVTWLGVA